MPILEVLQLHLKEGIQATSPTLLAALSKVRSEIGTKSRFYQSIEDPTHIYILGEWASLSAHQDYLASPDREKILGAQEAMVDFGWMVHMPFAGMQTLPLGAPVVAVARLFIKAGDDHPTLFEEAVMKQRHLIMDATKPWDVVHGWRCDVEVGKWEYLMFSGWVSVEAHDEFRNKTRAENAEYKEIRDHYEGMEVVHVRDLEML